MVMLGIDKQQFGTIVIYVHQAMVFKQSEKTSVPTSLSQPHGESSEAGHLELPPRWMQDESTMPDRLLLPSLEMHAYILHSTEVKIILQFDPFNFKLFNVHRIRDQKSSAEDNTSGSGEHFRREVRKSASAMRCCLLDRSCLLFT